MVVKNEEIEEKIKKLLYLIENIGKKQISRECKE